MSSLSTQKVFAGQATERAYVNMWRSAMTHTLRPMQINIPLLAAWNWQLAQMRAKYQARSDKVKQLICPVELFLTFQFLLPAADSTPKYDILPESEWKWYQMHILSVRDITDIICVKVPWRSRARFWNLKALVS